MKKPVLALFGICLAGTLYAADIQARLEQLLTKDVATRLLASSSVQNSAYRIKNAVPVFSPSETLCREAVAFWQGDAAPYFVESLYLYKKTPDRVTLPGAETEKISKILRSISLLQGLEYYSSSRKTMRTLYEKSFVVDGEKTQKQIADPVVGSADRLSLIALQKDLTFGEYLYRYNYRQTSDSVAFYSSNLESLKYGIVSLVGKDNLHVSLIVHDMGDYLLVYGLTRADFLAVPGIEGKINSSFSTRAEAMYKWFIKQYEARK